MTDAEALRRFVLAMAKVEPDLAAWTIRLVGRGLSPARRRQIRNDLLREASRLLPPMSAWQKARALTEATRRGVAPNVTTPAGLVALALRVYPGRSGLSRCQAFRVVFSKSHVEMQRSGAVGSKCDGAGSLDGWNDHE